MDVLKFSGIFTLEDTENKLQHNIPIQIVYRNDQHIVIIYEYRRTVQPDWLEAILTGVVTHFNLNPHSTGSVAFTCDMLESEQEEPEDNTVYTINFGWVNNVSKVIEVRESKNESN